MSKGGGKTVTTNTNSTTQPLDWQMPYIQGALGQADRSYYDPSSRAYTSVQQDILRGAPTYTGNLQSTLGKVYDLYDAADAGQMLKALSGFASSDPLSDPTVGSIGYGNITDAWQGLGNTARGDFLLSNPYIDSVYDVASRRAGEQFRDYTVPQTDAAFARAGRSGSGSYALLRNDQDETLGRTLSDLATDIYAGNYANERGLMQQAQGLLGQSGSNAISNAQSQRLNAMRYLSDFGMNAAQAAQQGELANLGFGLNAFRTAGDPLDAYFDRVGTLYGRAMEGTNVQPNPNKRGFGDILGNLGQMALIGGSFAVPGGGTLAGSLLGGGAAASAAPALTAASFGGSGPALGWGSPSFAF